MLFVLLRIFLKGNEITFVQEGKRHAPKNLKKKLLEQFGKYKSLVALMMVIMPQEYDEMVSM